MSDAEWKNRCGSEWGLLGAPMPDGLDWKSVYEAKPFGRNLLRNPSPFGLSKDIPPHKPDLPDEPDFGPPRFQPDGEEKDKSLFFKLKKKSRMYANDFVHVPALISEDFSGWTTNTEVLPYDRSGIPAGAVVCRLPRYSWFSLEQLVDLKAEGLWEELLDNFQPEIHIQDWYEESQLHDSIYQLQVKLLGADKSTVISEYTTSPTEDRSRYSRAWKEVSHVFCSYGPGVRYVHFLHKLKNMFLNGFYKTMFTNSTVVVRPSNSCS
uniref:P1, F-box associated domain containing n=1 Tax=Takifugu rubripes TaxID=31033 RepID=A0A674P119_TAKRU